MAATTFAEMKFLDPATLPKNEKLYSVLYLNDNDLPLTNFKYTKISGVNIHDVRPKKGEMSLDEEGFLVADFSSTLSYDEFYKEEALKQKLIPEVHAFLKSLLGVQAVFVHECVIRNRELKPGAHTRFGIPLAEVHTDYTLDYIEQLVGMLTGDQASTVKSRRFQMLNLWKPLRGPLIDWPLALCDLRSVAPDDLVKMDEVHQTAVLESHAVQYNDAQKWCYMSAMTTDEILIFKSADSRVHGAVPHGSFQDPRYPDAEPRESMELRVLVVY